ncbi:hypothetical protein CPB86DRAFT_871819 [Serendipita vermifera]|nr:hypothetical protein CPB86DRAFT_871819 [Serendipita vermifera]
MARSPHPVVGDMITVWASIDKTLGRVNWDTATIITHLILGSPLVLGWGIVLLNCLFLLWILALLGIFLTLTIYEKYIFSSSMTRRLRTAANQRWSEQRHRITIAIIVSKRRLHAYRIWVIPGKEGKKLPYLPPEIWKIILEFAVEVPFVFDTHCDARLFYNFIQAHQYSPGTHYSSYLKAEPRRRKLRMVCRMWAELMNRPNPYWALDHAPSPSRRNFNHIRRLDLGIKYIRPGRMRAPLSQQRRLVDSILTNPQSLSSITTVCICLAPISRFNEGMNSFLPHMRHLPQLRAMTYIDPSEDSSHIILLELRHPKFGNLTALYIQVKKLHGSLQLERLELLYLDVKSYEAGQWSFPSLRHLAINQGSESFLHPYSLNYVASPLAGSYTELQSLFFLDPYLRTVLDDSFWEAYPRLENLGVSSSNLVIQTNPPLGHPLNQIRLASPDINFQRLVRLSFEIPNLRQIYLPHHIRKIPESDSALFALLQECDIRGIRWISEDGEVRFKQEVTFERKRSSNEKFIGFLCSLYSYFAVYFYCVKGRWWEPFSPYHQGHVLLIIISFILWRATIFAYDRYVSPRYAWVARLN